MPSLLTRRHLLLGALGAAAACAPARAPASAPAPAPAPPRANREEASGALAEIEARVGGRVGVFALDTASGRTIARRPDERFAMCSTFKWALAATVLARVDAQEMSLDERVSFGPGDLLEYAPVTRARLEAGSMTVGELAEAAVTVSDNTAANLLLAKLGGPGALTRFARAHGDLVTRFDRVEPSLNTNDLGDPRDTTSPRAMVSLMREVLSGDALTAASHERLIGWLHACSTGKERLRAGLPEGWTAGDKTGTGARGAVNDVAIAWPRGRAPILVAAYMSGSQAELRDLVSAHAAIGRLVAREL